jgi:hypothetical protein
MGKDRPCVTQHTIAHRSATSVAGRVLTLCPSCATLTPPCSSHLPSQLLCQCLYVAVLGCSVSCVGGTDSGAAKRLTPQALLIFSRKGKNLRLIMEETLKNNLNFVYCIHYISKLNYNCDYTF